LTEEGSSVRIQPQLLDVLLEKLEELGRPEEEVSDYFQKVLEGVCA